MARRRRGDRALGPYPHGPSFRVILVGADGCRSPRLFPSVETARAFRDAVNRDAAKLPEAVSVDEAIDAYEKHLIAKGNKPTSYKETVRRMRRFFAGEGDTSVDLLTPARAKACYRRLVDTPIVINNAGATRRMAASSHMNMLLEARSFLRWCVDVEHYATRNALDGVKGEGNRKRGKLQLRRDEARAWLRVALRQAKEEDGAVAALMTLLLAMRASEIVKLRVRDVDDAGGLVWVEDAKTEAGNRQLEVPPILQPFLRALSRKRRGDERLFGKHWRDWPREWVQRICELAGVQKVTAHGLRGTHSTIATEAGSTGRVVADALGHEDTSTTEKSYTKREAVERARAARAMKVLDGGKPRRSRSQD